MSLPTELVVIDGDLIAYRSAAANEKRTIVATHKATGKKKVFDNRTALKEFLAEQEKFTLLDFEIEDVQTADDLAYALHSAKTTINTLCEACNGNNYLIVMSGKDNFRNDIPLPTRYKDNRKDTARPIQLQDVREYLEKYHPVEIAQGEADDRLAEYAYQGFKEKRKIVQCSIDKDALSNMGWLFDWTKMSEPIFINGLGELHQEGKKVKGTGRMWFYFQVLVGDPADCYKPTELCGVKFGDQGAYKLLAHLKSDKECWQAIADTYKKWYQEPVTYTAWDGKEYAKDYLEICQMYVDAAHMQRWKGDRIIVKDTLDKLGIEHA